MSYRLFSCDQTEIIRVLFTSVENEDRDTTGLVHSWHCFHPPILMAKLKYCKQYYRWTQCYTWGLCVRCYLYVL